jgi:hypothetical protein
MNIVFGDEKKFLEFREKYSLIYNFFGTYDAFFIDIQDWQFVKQIDYDDLKIFAEGDPTDPYFNFYVFSSR